MRFVQVVTLIVLIGMFVAGISQYIVSYDDAYNPDIDSADIAAIDSFVQIEELQRNVSSSNQKLLLNTGIEELDALTVITQGVIGGAKIIASTPTFLINMASAGFDVLAVRLGLSVEFLNGLVLLATLAVTFFIIYLLMKIKA